MIGEECTVLFEEAQEIGHLFQVRRHVRIVPAKMHVVELDVDDALDPVGAELAETWFGNGGRRQAECDSYSRRNAGQTNASHFLALPRSSSPKG